jgi:ATP dependent DNA ligase domain
MFHRGNPPCFFAFDLLTWNGKDLRTERLLDRKQELRRLLARSPTATFPLKYTEYIDGRGMALFQRVCEMDLEGIVAKQKFGPYVTEREHSTWFKIRNRGYSQKITVVISSKNAGLRMEARVGIEPTYKGFADLSLTTWVPRQSNFYCVLPKICCVPKPTYTIMQAWTSPSLSPVTNYRASNEASA